jgi:hypothetical protein
MPLELHFCTDRSGWRYLIPALLHLYESPFQWEACRHPQGFTLAQTLFRDKTFSFISSGCEEYVSQWLEIYGENLQQKAKIHCWGATSANVPITMLPPLDPAPNGFILDLKSRHPQRSLSSLLVERRIIHPLEHLKLHKIMLDSARILIPLNWTLTSLPTEINSGLGFFPDL